MSMPSYIVFSCYTILILWLWYFLPMSDYTSRKSIHLPPRISIIQQYPAFSVPSSIITTADYFS